MPYITQKARDAINKYGDEVINKPGELNYKITLMILDYLDRLRHNRKVGYAEYNEVLGVLECVKQELYRRLITPYEDKKREENGDVF